MRNLAKYEMKYKKYAIHELVKIITIITGLVFAILFVTPMETKIQMIMNLSLIPSEVLNGQIWRLVTYIFIPQNIDQPFFFAIALYFFYWIGTSLERAWGAFKFNVYYFTGMMATTLSAFLIGLFTPSSALASVMYLNLSLFLAFATLFPEREILLFMVLPIKVKYLGMLEALYVLYTVITSAFFGQWIIAAAALISLLNYFLFFGKDMFRFVKLKQNVSSNRKRYFIEIEKAMREKEQREKNNKDNVRKF
jgi:hypothetical protein